MSIRTLITTLAVAAALLAFPVVVVAGLTLLAGAAMGFEGARLTSRRRALRPSAS
jgi:hypothetical protein